MPDNTKSTTLSLAAAALLMALTRRTAFCGGTFLGDLDDIASIARGHESQYDAEVSKAAAELERAGLLRLEPYASDLGSYAITVNAPYDAPWEDRSWRSARRLAELEEGVNHVLHASSDLGVDATLLGLYVIANGAGNSAPVPVAAREMKRTLGIGQTRVINAKRRLADDDGGPTMMFRVIPAHRPGMRPDAIAIDRDPMGSLLAAEGADA